MGKLFTREQAIESVFPQTEIQRCIVHQIRNSCKFVGWKDRKRFCADMKLIYTAPNMRKQDLKLLTNLSQYGAASMLMQ
jgi:transposase-like protein